MPAQKRSHETSPSPPPQPQQPEEKDDDGSQQQQQKQQEVDQKHQEEEAEEAADSDGSDSTSDGETDEFVVVKLSDVRKEVQCPICLGIIRKTRTVMECLHRFCRECIDKSMRLGNNECPACRTHCASRRSLRDDPIYDTLISVLYPDIDKYEEEELAFHEDEKARNKQASIAETLQRQSEALGRKKTGRATTPAFPRRSHGNHRHMRGRRTRTPEHQVSGDEDDVNGNDGGKDSSSADDHSPEVKPKRYKRWGGNDTDMNRESLGAAAGLVGTSEILTWGKGGMRSHSRHGGLGSGNGRSVKNSRLSAIMDCLRRSDRDNKVYVAVQASIEAGEIQIWAMKGLQKETGHSPSPSILQSCESNSVAPVSDTSKYEACLLEENRKWRQIPAWAMKGLQKETGPSPGPSILQSCDSNSIAPVSDPSKYEACLLEEHQTLDELYTTFSPGQRNLLLAYGLK